jgi:hypothetical protein
MEWNGVSTLVGLFVWVDVDLWSALSYGTGILEWFVVRLLPIDGWMIDSPALARSLTVVASAFLDNRLGLYNYATDDSYSLFRVTIIYLQDSRSFGYTSNLICINF